MSRSLQAYAAGVLELAQGITEKPLSEILTESIRQKYSDFSFPLLSDIELSILFGSYIERHMEKTTPLTSVKT